MKLYIISDNHYFHSNIIEYENRPFDGYYVHTIPIYTPVQQMNEYMLYCHNSTVNDDDIVLNLGDFSFGGRGLVDPLVRRLKGKMYIIMGNHDRKRTVTWFEKRGFIKAFKKPVFLDNYVLSHEPVKPDEIKGTDLINLHGHIHNTVHYNKFLNDSGIPSQYANFAADLLDYVPFEVRDENMKEEILNFLLHGG